MEMGALPQRQWNYGDLLSFCLCPGHSFQGGIPLQFSDLQDLTLLHTHRTLKDIWMGFGRVTWGLQEISAPLEWQLEPGRMTQGISNVF